MNRNISSNIGFVNPTVSTSRTGNIRVRSYIPPGRSIQTASSLPSSIASPPRSPPRSPPQGQQQQSVVTPNIKGNDLVLQRRQQQQALLQLPPPRSPPSSASRTRTQRELEEEQRQLAAQLLYITGPDSM